MNTYTQYTPQQQQMLTHAPAYALQPQAAAPTTTAISLTSYSTFDQMLYVGDMLAKSTLVPKAFRGQPGSVLLALNMAQRLRLDPFMVMQNIYDVQGRPALSGQFAIALLNKSPKYRRIEYQPVNGVDHTAGMRVVGHRWDDPEDLHPDIGTAITPQMVQAEKWGLKWQTMPEQMYRYRAAAFFARAYCPEELMGMRLQDELEDEQAAEAGMRNVTPAAGLVPAADPAEIEAPKASAAPKKRAAKTAAPVEQETPETPAETPTEAADAPAAPVEQEELPHNPAYKGASDRILAMTKEANVKFTAFRAWCRDNGVPMPAAGANKETWDDACGALLDNPEMRAKMQQDLGLTPNMI